MHQLSSLLSYLCEERNDVAISLLRHKNEIVSPFGFAKTSLSNTFFNRLKLISVAKSGIIAARAVAPRYLFYIFSFIFANEKQPPYK